MASLDEIYQLLTKLQQQLEDLPARVEIAANQVHVTEGLSDISKRLGTVLAGEFRAGNQKTPGDGFSGVRIAYPSMMYNGQSWNVVGVSNDSLQFGLDAEDGKGYFAAGQAVMDSDAMKLTGMLYGLQHTATNEGTSRIGKIGMMLPDGSTTPAFQFAFEDAGTYAELLTNGGGESGSTTGWTDSDSAWSVSSSVYYSGSYSLYHPSGEECPGQLLQNVGSITPESYYTISFRYKEAIGAFAPSVTLVWKDSGSSTLRTDIVVGTITSSWTQKSQAVRAPASSASVDIILDAGDSFAVTYFDDVSFYASGLAASLYFAPELTVSGVSMVIGTIALATDATDGFLYIPTCSGAPTGTPTSQTGTAAMVYDTSNGELYVYNGGWVSVALT